MSDSLKANEKHLTADELELVVEQLRPLVMYYGTLGIEEGMAELARELNEDDDDE